jgi:hypothetical protein
MNEQLLSYSDINPQYMGHRHTPRTPSARDAYDHAKNAYDALRDYLNKRTSNWAKYVPGEEGFSSKYNAYELFTDKVGNTLACLNLMIPKDDSKAESTIDLILKSKRLNPSERLALCNESCANLRTQLETEHAESRMSKDTADRALRMLDELQSSLAVLAGIVITSAGVGRPR